MSTAPHRLAGDDLPGPAFDQLDAARRSLRNARLRHGLATERMARAEKRDDVGELLLATAEMDTARVELAAMQDEAWAAYIAYGRAERIMTFVPFTTS